MKTEFGYEEFAEVSGVITNCTNKFIWFDDGDTVVPRIPKHMVTCLENDHCRDIDLCEIEKGKVYTFKLPYEFAYEKGLI